MNRKDFIVLTNIRSKEVKKLFLDEMYDAAYYLGGYLIEYALKACISKKTKRHDFPDKILWEKAFTHDLEKLLNISGLKILLDKSSNSLKINWAVVKDWNESSRYERHSKIKTESFIKAIFDKNNGILRWIKQHW